MYISFYIPFAFTAFFFDTHARAHARTHTQTYQLRGFPLNSTLTSTKNQRIFSILVPTTPISPDVINLSNGTDVTCLPLQNQITKEEDKTTGKAILCLRL